MPSNLPTFESTAKIEPGPIVSAAPATAAINRAAQTVFSGIKQQTQTAADKDLRIQGENAGLNPNFKPKGFGPDADVFNNAALATNKQMISNDIATHNNTLLETSSQIPDAQRGMSSYTQSMQEYGKNLLQNVPVANRATALELLKYHTNSGQLQMQKRLDKQNSLHAQMNYMNTAQTRHDSMVSAIQNTNGDVDSPEFFSAWFMYNQAHQANELAATGGVITPQEYNKSQSKLKNDFNGTLLLTQHKSSMANGTEQKFLQNFNDDNSIAPKQKEIYFNQFMHQRKMALDAAGVSTESARSALSKNIADIYKGGQVNERVVSNYKLAFPEQADNADQEVSQANVGFSVIKTASSLPATQQQGYINARLKPDPLVETSEGFNKSLNLYNRVNSAVSNINHQKNSDPVLFAQQHPELQRSISEQQNQEDTGALPIAASSPQSIVRTIPENPVDKIAIGQMQGGTPRHLVKVMSNNVAQQVASEFASLPANQMPEYFASLKSPQYSGENGQWFPNVLTQLQKHGLPQSASWLASINPQDPNASVAYSAFSQSSKDLEGNLTSEQSKALSAAIDTQVKSATQGFSDESTPGFFTRLENRVATTFGNHNVRNMIASMSAVKSTTSSNSTSITSVVKNLGAWSNRFAALYMHLKGSSAADGVNTGLNLVAAQFNYGTINGSMIRTPKGLNQDAVISYAKNYQKNRLAAFPFAVDSRSAAIYGVKNVNGPGDEFASWLGGAAAKLGTAVAGGGFVPTQSLQDLYENAISNKEVKLTPRQMYYNQKIANGHWATMHDNSGLYFAQSDGVPMVTAQGRRMSIPWQQIQDNMPPDFGSPLYYARQAVDAVKDNVKESVQSLEQQVK